MGICTALLLCCGGCSPPDEPPTPGDDDAPQPALEIDFEVSVSDEIITVAIVSGTIDTDECEQVSVQLETEDGYETLHAAAFAEGQLSATLVGLKAETGYAARIAATCEAIDQLSDPRTFVTGMAPPYIPDMALTEYSTGSERSGFWVTSVIKRTSVAIILDQDLDLVWWHMPDVEESVISRAALTRSGDSVLYMVEQPVDETNEWKTELVRVSLDGSERSSQSVDGAHHDFVELPDGTVAMLVRDVRWLSGEPAMADAIMELLPSGDKLTVWSAWDDFLPDPDWAAEVEDATLGWSHANALDYDPDTDSYLVGLRNLDAIVAVSRDSGELLWQLGGDESDYALDGEGEPFAKQHQFQLLDDGLLVFDNGPPQDYDSRVVEYSLDPEAGVAVESWQHHANPLLYSPVLGDVHRNRDGSTLVTWGSAGLLQEVSPEGDLLWSMALGYGGALGYTTPVEELLVPGVQSN